MAAKSNDTEEIVGFPDAEVAVEGPLQKLFCLFFITFKIKKNNLCYPNNVYTRDREAGTGAKSLLDDCFPQFLKNDVYVKINC